MAQGGLPVEKLRQYLRQLSPQALGLLVTELERALLRGADVPGGDLVLQEVRAAIREAGDSAPRVGNSARLFFRPLEPFLIPDTVAHAQHARIPRKALDPIWEWICRDVVPDDVRTFADEINRSLVTDDIARAEQLTRTFQDHVVASIEQMLDAVQTDEKARRRLGVQVGSPRGLDDVHDMLAIFKARDALAMLGARLPGHIRNLGDDQIHSVKSLIDTAAPRRGDALLFAMVLTMGRLAAPWQIIRLALLEAKTDDIARISGTSYADVIPLVLGEIERSVSDLEADLKRAGGSAVISLLKWIHDAVRGLRTEVDMPIDHPLGRRLADIRAEIARILKTEIESMPGRVRRLLRMRTPKEIAAGSMLDVQEVADTEALIEVVDACRHYASELAVSEMTLRTWSDIEHYLDTNCKGLIDSLRTASAGDRPFRQSQVDAAVRFCAIVFGRDYAAVLRKSAEVAIASERKAAQAS